MPKKQFHIPAKNIKRLVEHDGGCIATDMITVDGCCVGYMYREPPDNNADLGWRFMAGSESDDYMDDSNNHGVYSVNTIANYDPEILPLLNSPIGSAFARNSKTGAFERVDSPVDPDACLHPDFPIVSGSYSLTSNWSLSLPLKFNRRIEDGSLILWRPGFTIYFTIWNNDNEESIDQRLKNLVASASPDAFESKKGKKASAKHFSYRLLEDGVNALYGFVIANDGHLQVAIYFEDESDIEMARSVFGSVEVKAA